MQAQQAILTFTEAERPLGDRLLKLTNEIDRVEGYSEPHAIVIARLSEKLGAMMGLHGSDLTSLKFAALAHDIGERQTKRNYLLRHDALTWEETLDLWRHPILGEQASAELRLPRHAQLIIRWHHEWWNGLGYPDGLAGETIPLGARILRAVDSFYALISTRPHRQRYDALDAEQIIADLAGIEFDPLVIKFLLTALVEERTSRESEYWPTAGTPLLPVEMIAEGPPPFLAISEEFNAIVKPVVGTFPSPMEGPVEVTNASASVPTQSREATGEPLSELLAEMPETNSENKFFSPQTTWPESADSLHESVELTPIDPEQPTAETASGVELNVSTQISPQKPTEASSKSENAKTEDEN